MEDTTKLKSLEHLVVDARALAQFLIDMPAEWERRGLLRRHKGFDEAWFELETNQGALGERAGITARDYEALCTAEEQLRQILELLPRARKLAELLEENAARLDDRIQRTLHGLAAIIEVRAQTLNDPELLGPYERLLLYRSARQRQGAKTRKRNRAAAQAAASTPGTPRE